MLIIINNSIDANQNKCGYLVKKLLTFLKQINIKYKVLDNSIKSTQFIINNEKNISGFIFSSSNKRVNEINLDEAITCNYVLFNINKPILGICFGHQLIAKLNLGVIKSYDNNYRHIGIIKTSVNDFELLEDNTYNIEYDHHDFLTTIPNNYISCCYITNKNKRFIPCIKHKNKQIYGMQFHPELCIQNENKLNVYFAFLDICKLKYNKNKLNIQKINNITNKLYNCN